MPYEFELRSTTAPEDLAKALAASSGHSVAVVPPELRKNGVRSVKITLDSDQFTIVPVTLVEWGSLFALRGRIEGLPDGGSRVTGKVELESQPFNALWLPGLIGLYLLLTGSLWGLAWLALAGALLLRDHSIEQRVSPSSSVEAEFLLAILTTTIKRSEEGR